MVCVHAKSLQSCLTLCDSAAAAAKSLQSCPTLCDPIDGSPPGSPVPGILRQEHWSGLPFPSPMHESDKWKWSRSVMSDSLWPHGLQPTRLLHPWDFPGKSNWSGVPYGPWTGRLLGPWDSPGKNAGVSCHALLQGIFLTEGSNRCLLCLLHW